jgi:hypothetical protein
LISIIAFLIIAVTPRVVVAAPNNDIPFTIFRVSYDNSGGWEVHVFYLLPEEGPLGILEDFPNDKVLQGSLLDYALFRARNILDFEGALREGLVQEFKRRDRLKHATYLGAYLFCIPFWPAHLFWELPLSGVEKERMLQQEGYTLQLPIVEPGSVGEIPLPISWLLSTDEAGPNFDDDELQQPYWPAPGPEDWLGAGLNLSYRVNGESFTSTTDAVDGSTLFPGWPTGSKGILLLMFDFPAGGNCRLQVGEQTSAFIFSSWPGRYDWPLGNAVYIHSGNRMFLGVRQAKVEGKTPFKFELLPKMGKYLKNGHGHSMILTNIWPESKDIINLYPVPSVVIPGAVVLFILFHVLNLIGLKVGYRRDVLGAIYDPIIVHLCILAFATAFAPFLGLGWVFGAYVAGRFLKWRHPQAQRPWLIIVAYALLLGLVNEILFARILWI